MDKPADFHPLPTPLSREQALARMRRWIDALRPQTGESTADRMRGFVARLESDGALRDRVRDALRTLLLPVEAVDALTSAGILGETPLPSEFLGRLSRRVLPPAPAPADLQDLVGILFQEAGDADWLSEVPDDAWEVLDHLLGMRLVPGAPIPTTLDVSIRVLAHRVAALGLRPLLTSRVPELGREDSPFLALSDQVLGYIRSHGDREPHEEEVRLHACLDTLQRCREAVTHLRANKHRYGTSLELTGLSFRMVGLVDRLEILLELTDPDARCRAASLGRLIVALVRARERRDHLGPLLRQYADLLAYQVVEHAAKKGRAYITSTRPEYWAFLLSSLGGGLIVALFALTKVWLGGVASSPAGEGLLFSLNYALCFVLIYLSGATLATKQPGVTAHTLAASLDGPGDRHHLGRLVEMIARAWRSQTISFVGNLAMAFPVGLLLALGWHQLFGAPVVDPDKAAQLLTDIHPLRWTTLWYAAIAGVFLFGSGVVSGWVDNRFVYSHIPERIGASATLRRLLGPGGVSRLARYVDAKAGALAGNVFLGFCLGGTGVVGEFLGLPLDIRHIAFASAHLAMGLEGMAWEVATGQIVLLGVGVALIGLVNFLVSFGFALLLAVESRQLTFGEGRKLLRLVGKRLRTHPLDFLFPPAAPQVTARSSEGGQA
jgi:site-specific recombinase